MNKKNETRRPTKVKQELSCAVCGEATVTTSWLQHTFMYGSGRSAVELTARVPVRSCADCEFEWLDEVGERLQHEAICGHFGVLPPEEIRQIRAVHGMTRARFSEVTGLGEASLNRWENGINIQTHANDRYLRLLANPRAMRELKRLVAREKSVGPDSGPTVSQFQVIELDEVRRKREEGQGFHVRLTADLQEAA